jgi:hypothetical protein
LVKLGFITSHDSSVLDKTKDKEEVEVEKSRESRKKLFKFIKYSNKNNKSFTKS